MLLNDPRRREAARGQHGAILDHGGWFCVCEDAPAATVESTRCLLRPPQQLRQLGEVRRHPPRFVPRKVVRKIRNAKRRERWERPRLSPGQASRGERKTRCPGKTRSMPGYTVGPLAMLDPAQATSNADYRCRDVIATLGSPLGRLRRLFPFGCKHRPSGVYCERAV